MISCKTIVYTCGNVLRWLHHLANGLDYLHNKQEAQIIHRDIKPKNLLLTKDCTVLKIADFGLSRDEAESFQFTRAGTKPFTPPEVTKGKRLRVLTCRAQRLG